MNINIIRDAINGNVFRLIYDDLKLDALVSGQSNDNHKNLICSMWNGTDYSLRYNANINIIDQIFRANTSNTDRNQVARKVSILDYCYSTNLKEGYVSAVDKLMDRNIDFEHAIQSPQLSDRVNLINRILVISNQSRSGLKTAVSFVTKYCANHIRIYGLNMMYNFPIYDENVKTMLFYLNKKFGFYHNHGRRWTDTCINDSHYDNYCETLDAFNTEFFSGRLSYWDLDQYLWIWSKIIIYIMTNIPKTITEGDSKAKRRDCDGNEISNLLDFFLNNI